MKKRHLCTLVGMATLPPVASYLALDCLGWPSATSIDQHVRLWVFGSLGAFSALAIWWCLSHEYFEQGLAVPFVGLWCSVQFAKADDLPAELMMLFEGGAVLTMLGGLVLALADHWSTPEPSRAATPTTGERRPVTAVPASPQPVEPQLLQHSSAAPVYQRFGGERPAVAGVDTGHVGRRLFLDEGPQA